jgi:ketosteroid isomerase-like protein
MSEANKQAVDRINKAFMDGNTEGFLELCADDVVWTMEGEKTTTGKKEIREWMRQMEGHTPPKFTVDKTIAEGDSVVCYGTMSMDEPKEAAGKYSFCDAYTFSGGKVKGLRSFVVKHKTEGERSETAAG